MAKYQLTQIGQAHPDWPLARFIKLGIDKKMELMLRIDNEKVNFGWTATVVPVAQSLVTCADETQVGVSVVRQALLGYWQKKHSAYARQYPLNPLHFTKKRKEPENGQDGHDDKAAAAGGSSRD